MELASVSAIKIGYYARYSPVNTSHVAAIRTERGSAGTVRAFNLRLANMSARERGEFEFDGVKGSEGGPPDSTHLVHSAVQDSKVVIPSRSRGS